MSKIKRLVIKNCLGIEELAFNPGQITVISGGNERGKTSILETIEKVLYNSERRAKFVRSGSDKAYIELDTDDGMKVERTISCDESGVESSNSKVTVGGIPEKAPESYLKNLFGQKGKKKADVFAFNPVDLMTKKDTEQTDILLGLMPISYTEEEAKEKFGIVPPVDYSKHGLQIIKDLEKYWYDARREANSAVKATSNESVAVAKRLPDNYQIADWENIELSKLYDELRAAEKVNVYRDKAQKIIDDHESIIEQINNKYLLKEKELQEFKEFKMSKVRKDIESEKGIIQAEISDIDANIESCQEQIRSIEKNIEVLNNNKTAKQTELKNIDSMGLVGKEDAIDRENAAKLEAINNDKKREVDEKQDTKTKAEKYLSEKPAIYTEPMEFNCKHVETMKQHLGLAKELQGIMKRLENNELIAQEYDNFVQYCREKPAELLKTIELPFDGIGINSDNLITLNGLPIKNLSTSKQVRVCLDIARVYAKNNPLKLICIDKLECLDETVRKEFLTQIEEDSECQFFVTLVTDGDLKIETRGER